jgi:SAM-dependent methyltransferase
MNHALYDQLGIGYSDYRRPDDRIAARIEAALGQSRSVLNVGAGTGSYEPKNRFVVAVEPSAEMIRQRSQMAAQAIQGAAGRLPFENHSFDAALAILTIHHWSNREHGLAEMQRIARERVVIFTWDPEHPGFWLVRDYLPEILEIDRHNFPSLRDIETAIGPIEVQALAVPADCADGFLGAYWRRPAAYLDPHVRAAISTFSKLDAAAGIGRLRTDLEYGIWTDRYGALVALSELDIGYRLVVARCA